MSDTDSDKPVAFSSEENNTAVNDSPKKKRKKKRKSKQNSEGLIRDSMLQNAKKDADEQELELEKLVFGGETDILEQLTADDWEKKHAKKKKYASDESDDGDNDGPVLVSESEEPLESENRKALPKPVWEDEDDDNILVSEKASSLKNCHRSVSGRGQEKYKEYVRERFLKVNGAPKWAKLDKKQRSDDSSAEDSDEELLQKTGNFIAKSASLPKQTIDIRKCQNLTEVDSHSTVIKSVEFHPLSKVALVAGLDGTAKLYQVDGKDNPKIQSVYFERFPIYTAHFTVDGNELIVGSRAFGHYFTYDMIHGKINRVPWEKGMEQMNVKRFHVSPDGKLILIHGRYGNIHLISAKSKEWISSLKMNGEAVAVTFNKDGSKMYSHGSTGQIYVWDMTTRQCIYKFNDEGCITGTALAVSPNEQFLATGSDSGVVNIYENSSLHVTSDPKPLKVVMNLTTEVTNLKFNCTSEILTMASSHKKESVRLAHFPSMTVFSNFPVREKKLHYVNSVDLSLNSGYLMLGNNIGKVYLYRLRHYANY